MRDALSVLDQVIAFSSYGGGRVTADAVRESVGLIEGQTLLGITAGIFRRKPLEALALVDQAYQRGHDLRVLTRGLIEMIHGSILAKVGAPGSALLELSSEEWQELQALAGERAIEELELIFQVLHHGLDWIARSPQPKVVLDILLVKCATAEALISVDGASASGGGSARGLATANAAVPSSKPVVSATPVASAHITAQTTPVSGAANPKPVPKPEADSPSSEAGKWEGLIAHVRKTRPLLASILENASSEGLTVADGPAPLLSLSFSPENAYFKEQLQSPAYSTQLSAFCQEYFGKPTRIALELKAGGESLAAKKKRDQETREKQTRESARNHPILMEARSLFGGELGPIEMVQEGPHAEA